MTTHIHPPNKDNKLFDYYSSWHALQRAAAWILKFYYWLKSGKARPTDLRLTVQEIQAARERIIEVVQQNTFGDDIAALQSGKLPSRSSIYRLEPQLDAQGIIRVGGRIPRE